MTVVQAIDRLQTLDTKFRELWWKNPFLVLADGFALPATMAVPRMLAEIEGHGKPVGIVGVAVLSPKKWTVLKHLLVGDAKARKHVENSAEMAGRLYEDSLRSQWGGTVYTDGTNGEIHYSWDSEKTLAPGWERAGYFDLVQNKDGDFELEIKIEKKHAAIMAKAKELFLPYMDQVAALLKKEATESSKGF